MRQTLVVAGGGASDGNCMQWFKPPSRRGHRIVTLDVLIWVICGQARRHTMGGATVFGRMAPRRGRTRRAGGWLPRVMATGILGMLAALPALAYAESPDFTVSDAEYDWDDNTLILNFTGRLNIFDMDMSNISITDGACALAFTRHEYDGRGSDYMSLILKPNENQRESLASMIKPHIQFRNDTFYESGTNTMMAPIRMPLGVVGDPPYNDPKCVITYGYNDASLELHAYDYNQTRDAVHDGIGAWSDLNPNLEFVHVDDDPLIQIKWTGYEVDYLGLACVWCLDHEPIMEIVLYGYDCRKVFLYHDPNTVRNTVAHELGHILGLDHHTNQTHLMYGSEYQADPYETYGLVVPGMLEEGFIGEAELYERILVLTDELDRLGAEIDRLGAELDKLAAKASLVGNTLYFDTQSQVNQYNRLLSEYDGVWDEYDVVWDEYDAAYEEWDCMREAYGPGPSGGPDLEIVAP